MKILLTGASGFVGSALLRLLLARGHRVYALGRRETKFRHSGLTTVIKSVGNDLNVDDLAWNEIDAVIHLAASGVKSSNRAWPEAVKTNILGTLSLLDAIKRCAAKTPLFIWTRSFYEHLVEKCPQLLENPYVATKLSASNIIKLWSESYSGRVALVSLFQVYGPGDSSSNVLTYAATQFARGEVAKFGEANSLRDWVYIDDVARALLEIVEQNTENSGNSLAQYDVGSGEMYTISDMVRRLAVHAGVCPEKHCDYSASRNTADSGLSLAAKRLPPQFRVSIYPDQGLSLLWEAVRGLRPDPVDRNI